VDDFAALLGLQATKVGFAETVRRLAAGTVEYPLHEPFGKPITPTEAREAPYRETEAFWDTFSRGRLVQQQLNALDQPWDAVEEVWLRAEVNFAESILDVGTGWGGAFQHLLERGPQDAIVFGCDTTFLNLKIAQGRAERAGFTHAAFVVGDITLPPFASGLFDAVVSWFGIGAFPRMHAAFEGIGLVLGPGRSFGAAWTPLIDDMEGLAGRDDLIRLAQHLDIPISPDEVAEAAEEAGFEDVETATVGPIYVVSGRSPAGGKEDSQPLELSP
jgi:SAM-dependent methyltransferase